MRNAATWRGCIGLLVFGLAPATALGDGIEVLDPAGPVYPLGQELAVRYHLTEPYTGSPTQATIYMHRASVGEDLMGFWTPLWHWGTGAPASVEADGTVTVPITIPDDLPLADDYVITVVLSSDVSGTSRMFELVSHFGDIGDADVGGTAIIVTYPRRGVSWQRGMQYSIAWQVFGFGFDEHPMPRALFNIEIFRSGRFVEAFQPPRSGWNRLQCNPESHLCSAGWVVPNDPERYGEGAMTVRVSARDPDGGPRYSGESDRFEIRAGGLYLGRPQQQWPGIDPEILDRREQTYYLSHVLPIRWQTRQRELPLPDRFVELSLLGPNGGVVQNLGTEPTSASGVGTKAWEIGRPEPGRPDVLTVVPGVGYRIRIHKSGDPALHDDSVRFNIAAPSISVEAPSRPPDGLLASNEFFRDEVVDVNWTSTHLRESQLVDVLVTVEDHGCRDRHVVGTDYLAATEIPAPRGQLSWEIWDSIMVAGYPQMGDYPAECYPVHLRFRVQLQEYEHQIFGETGYVSVYWR